MFHHETADNERFEEVILLAVRQIIHGATPQGFLAWAGIRVPEVLGLYGLGLDAPECRRLAHLLATSIWNATPRPDRGFRCEPLAVTPPAAPCPCGSGRRYRDCCGDLDDLDDLPELSSNLIWELLLDELPERLLKDALEAGAIPRPLLARLADRWLEEDRPGRAVALLEPVFTDDLADLDGEYEPACDVLCDAYDRLDHWRKKLAFLERLCRDGSRALKAYAWQRRSTICIDEGDFAGARAAFAAALRSDPDNPGTALLEITLLAAQHQDELARARAGFWLHRLRRLGYREEGFMTFLAQAVDDPQGALVDSHADALDPILLDLYDWVAVTTERPLPDYRVVPVRPATETTMPPPLTADDQEPVRRRPLVVIGIPAELRPPPAVRRLEAHWRTLFPSGKPESTRLTLADGGLVWQSTRWSDYLLGHPDLADSLDCLDDLASALYEHPESSLPWISHALLRPLLARAWALVNHALPPDDPHFLPWVRAHNRPLLRLLFRHYLCQVDEGQPQAAAATLETLLRLNPPDNHGVRAELMNHYLRTGQDQQALALARRFPDDLLADLAYGEVLALYRLGEQERARAVLGTAVHRLPRIPSYLTRNRIKRPHPSPLGATPGGEDQAWMYREAMRDVWAAEPGILRWLKRVTA